ncbi:multidrug resistance-associated protein 1-like isoform X1 [Biomphalaria pfeifferi]|uniref:ABC-type glutathione-S-conjugate transporter n=1 Tax=Biomphalaria pfeifferi TaxID=112525 RepID=A0AAD8B0K0_BIOPF|nr:multidrug resistance-associated protein 1-like isoform X1 [Biomphalaria pfeifferi]
MSNSAYGWCREGSEVWNESLLLNSSYPQFTECFKDTVLVWVPCGVLWSATPLYLYYLSAKKKQTIPLNCLNVMKTIWALLLMVLSVVSLIHDNSLAGEVPVAKYVAGGVKIATFLLVALLLQAERHYGFITSGVLFITFTLLVIAGVIPFYSNIIEETYNSDLFDFVLYCIYFGFLLIEYFLLFWADKKSEEDYNQIFEKEECPETKASFPSQIVFFWISKLLVHGYRKDLEEKDVFRLNPRDQSNNVVPDFESQWEREKQKAKMRNRLKRKEYKVKTSSFENPSTSASETSALLQNEIVQFSESQNVNAKKIEASLLKTLVKVFGGPLLISQIFKLLADLLTFVTPMLIEQFISFTQHRRTEREWKGYVLACSFFVVAMLKTCLYQYHFHLSMTLGIRIKSAVTAAVYKKALTISNESRKESTVGEIVNLVSVDCQRLQDVTGYLYVVWSMPLMIVLALYMLWGTLGPSSMAGLGVLLFLMPINIWTASKQRTYQMQQMKTKDKRIKIMNEVLNGIKVLKLYGWEDSFQAKITSIREEELTTLRKTAYLVAITMFIWTCAPYVVQLVSFGTYIAVSESGYLDPSTAFVSISLFGILRQPMAMLPMIIPFLIQADVSISRVSKFLCSEDLDSVVDHDPNCDAALQIENGTFTWDSSLHQPTLRRINVNIASGSLVAIVGTVGSGKSSLLSAMLGEMKKLKGKVTIKDRIAYVSQEAWIQNATLRDNILFESPYNSSEYEKVIDACALRPDLEIFPARDKTEIGEKGINLSGGQKQRVSLARAVYSQADIYLLDDPLSAVDAHVGKHIFKAVISHRGILKDKTRVLVTHGIHWLPFVDHIIVVDNGQISEEGSYDALLSHEGAFAKFLKEYFQQESESEVDEAHLEDPEIHQLKNKILERLKSVTSDATSEEDTKRHSEKIESVRRRALSYQSISSTQIVGKKTEQKLTGQQLIEEEKVEIGKVKYNVYLVYIKAVGLFTFIFMTLIFTIFQGSSTFSAIWLSMWTDDKLLANVSAAESSEYVAKNNLYLGIYGALGFAQALLLLTFAILATTKMVMAAGRLHFNLLDNILKAPMSFFDTTPIGRIVNRFSKDVETVDNTLPNTIRTWYMCVFAVLGTIATISYSTPLFLVVIVPLGILYWLIQRFYIPTSRQLKRIESTTRSLIYVHFTETVSGAATIRAYGVTERFIEDSKARVDHNLSFYFASLVSNRWLGLYLECIGNLIILAAAIFVLLTEGLPAGLVGLSVSYATEITSALNYVVRTLSDLETNIVSVERIKEYCETENEKARIIPFNRPHPSWPQEGKIKFIDYKARYRPGLELVLRGVTCEFKAGEKIGIVGRTGAGKSSLTIALFRLIEADSGSITIDGIRLSAIGLFDLRSKLTILPQDPVIFSGTLRMNLDPFNEHSDDLLWSALEHAHLKAYVDTLPQKLNYECGEGGLNLSVGQRQLICLARALIRKTKVLVLDEATAAVDMATDELIQKTIRSEFKDCTVLAIAHRLNTVMDYDKILVMDKGQVKEFDSPQTLLADKNSVFCNMAKDAGIV